jgi:hypothetical protein
VTGAGGGVGIGVGAWLVEALLRAHMSKPTPQS